jgi:hypothetical protein
VGFPAEYSGYAFLQDVVVTGNIRPMSGVSASVPSLGPVRGGPHRSGDNLRGIFDETNFDRAIASALEGGRDEMAHLDELSEAAIGPYSFSLPTADGLGPLLQEVASATDAFAERIPAHVSQQRDVLSTFNVAFFGRTGAGKSTLLSAFGQLDGHDVSPGDSDWMSAAR